MREEVGDHLLRGGVEERVVDLRLLEEQHLVLERDLVHEPAAVVGLGDIAGEDFLKDVVISELYRCRVFPGKGELRLKLLGEADLRPIKIGRFRGVDLNLDAPVEYIGASPRRDLRVK